MNKIILTLGLTLLLPLTSAHALVAEPDGYVDGEPVYCADADCGIGDGAEPLSDGPVRAGDGSGQMIPVVGGDDGQRLLQALTALSSSDNAMQSLRARIALKIVLQRWFEISQQ